MYATLVFWSLVAGVRCNPDDQLPQVCDDPSTCVQSDGEDKLPPHTSLLQTAIQVEPIKKSKFKHTSLLTVSSTVHERSNATYALKTASYHLDKDACFPIWPMEAQLEYAAFSNMGILPSRESCRDWRPPQHSHSLLSVSINTVHKHVHQNVIHPYFSWMGSISNTTMLVFTYFMVMAIVLSCMIRVVYMPPPPMKPMEAKQIRAEAEAWKESALSWFCISWATPWIQRWGHATDKVKIKATELGLIGDPEDECKHIIKSFSRIYKEQAEKRSNNILATTLVNYIGWKRIIPTVLTALAYESMLYIGPTCAVHWILNTLNFFYQERAKGIKVTMEDYFTTIMGILFMFTAMPLVMTCFNTYMYLLTCRINNRIQASCGMAIYLKSQRLPAGQKSYDLTDEHARKQKEEWGVGLDAPKDYSIVNLMSTDVNTNLTGMVLAVVNVLTTTPIIIFLGFLLISKLGKAIFYFIIAVGAAGFVFAMFSMLMITYMIKTQYAAGTRLAFFQEMMFGVRIMKSYAWEDTAKQRINEIRTYELSHLRLYWKWMGAIIGFVLMMPRLCILSCLVGYLHIYGEMAASDIFVLMQILNAFQGAAATWSGAIPLIISARPSLARIENFLAMKEADLPADKTQDAMPTWATTWSKGTEGSDLQMKGSFSWLRGQKSVLHDIDFCVAKGEKVAIVGEVGSGKTTFLQALCGDLSPVGDARLNIPTKTAYHSQVPHIIEGTLKENILFYQQYDMDLYNRAIHAACLNRDLEVLPGGDSVPIGSRGITLSGGQRARVSVARAAYCKSAQVVLLDDPLASVDGPTGKHIIDNLFRGPMLEGRTLVCVCQPHPEVMQSFDRVYVMKDGCILAQGEPSEVVKSEEFQALMSQNVTTDYDHLKQTSKPVAIATKDVDSPQVKSEAHALREEESEGRFDWGTLRYFIFLGGWKRLFLCFAFYIGMIVTNLLGDITLARWMNQVMYKDAIRGTDPEHMSLYHFVDPWSYIWLSIVWVVAGAMQFAWSWYVGIAFTISISEVLHTRILNRLMRAPIDRFYDKTPVGRILNRLSSDMSNLDQKMFTQMTSTSAQFCWIIIPITYIHMVMPMFFTVFAVVIYYPMLKLFLRYINVVVPLRYLTNVTRSEVNVFSSEVDNSKTTVRSFQVQDKIAGEMCTATDNLLKAQFAGDCIKRWTSNRMMMLYSLLATSIAVIAALLPDMVNVGQLSVCLNSVIFFIMKLDFVLDMLTSAQFEFVCMNRLYEYLDLPSERAYELESDAECASWTVHFPRAYLQIAGHFEVRECPTGAQVVWIYQGQDHLIFDQVKDQETMKCHDLAALALLHTIPGCERVQMSHQITACNDACGDAKKIAVEYGLGNSDGIQLRFQSQWLKGGATVQITDLVAGYADAPSNVLRGVNLTVEAKTKAAIVGTTGCGKSTMILCLLRILEPRAGKILINDVDTQDIGLKTLRTCIGLVPQDPFVFSGSIRLNLDPFHEFTDTRIWNALKAVQLADFIKNLGQGLGYMCATDGSNLSFGQRQLLCVARMVVRQPSLLLLDECTSAIDPRTQELVQEAIRKCFPESTLLVIAHRLDTILDFDMIICLEQGRVVEKGSVKDLANQPGGLFAKMLAAR